MPNEQLDHVSVDNSDPRVRLACERTLLAYERTQIAWVRTALALISFGFAISTFFSYLREQQGESATVLSPRAVGHHYDRHRSDRSHSCHLAAAARGEIAPPPLSRFTGADWWSCHGRNDRVPRRPRLAGRPDSLNLLNRIALTVQRNFPNGLPVLLVKIYGCMRRQLASRASHPSGKHVAPLITR